MKSNHFRRRVRVAGLGHLTPLSILVAFLASAVASAAPTHIQFPADPPARRTAQLQEVWTVGGEDDEDILLGLVSTGAIDEEGNVFLVDRQLSQVLKITPNGELDATLGREGEGPGELNRPHSLFLPGDGAVGVVQGFPGKVTLINADGTPGGEIHIGGPVEEGGFQFVRELALQDGKLVGTSGRSSFDMDSGKSVNRSTLSVMDYEGNELASIVEHEMERDFTRHVFDEAKEFSEMEAWTLGPGGMLYTTPERDAYVLNVRGLDGAVQRVYQREFSPRKRTGDDRERMIDDMIIVINGERQMPENKALDHDPAIVGLDAAKDGRLFVTNCFAQAHLLPAGTAGVYDVISADGEFLEELTLTVPDFDAEQDLLYFLDGKHFLVIYNHESGMQAMRAGFGPPGGGDDEDEAVEALAEAEPLAVSLYVLP